MRQYEKSVRESRAWKISIKVSRERITRLTERKKEKPVQSVSSAENVRIHTHRQRSYQSSITQAFQIKTSLFSLTSIKSNEGLLAMLIS